MSFDFKTAHTMVKQLEGHVLPRVRADGGIPLVTAFIKPDGAHIHPWKVQNKGEIAPIAHRMGLIARKADIKELIVVGTAVLMGEDNEGTMAVMYTWVNLHDNLSKAFFRPYTIEGDSIIFDTEEPIAMNNKPYTDIVPFIMDGFMEGEEECKFDIG